MGKCLVFQIIHELFLNRENAARQIDLRFTLVLDLIEARAKIMHDMARISWRTNCDNAIHLGNLRCCCQNGSTAQRMANAFTPDRVRQLMGVGKPVVRARKRVTDPACTVMQSLDCQAV